MSNERARAFRLERYPDNPYLAPHEVDRLMQSYADHFLKESLKDIFKDIFKEILTDDSDD